MKLIVHVPSALCGALFATLALASLGAQGITVTPLNPPVVVSGIPTPSQLTRVHESLPLTVPHGKVFVAVSMGTQKSGSYQTEVHIDGSLVYRRLSANGDLRELPPPYVAAGPGSIVEVMGGDSELTDALLWGYLADMAM